MPLTTRVPSIVGVIDRRMLVNFRIDPARARAVLPPSFRPLWSATTRSAGSV